MITDVVPAAVTFDTGSPADRAVASFLRWLERRLGVSIVRPLGRDETPALSAPRILAQQLKDAGVISQIGRFPRYADEPQTHWWYALCNDATHHQTGGMSLDRDDDALYPALAEALERYIWLTQDDHFDSPLRSTESVMARHGPYIAPGVVSGFSDTQRREKHRMLTPEAQYLWIRGTSLTDGARTYLPAQLVSGLGAFRKHGGVAEPVIRQSTTNGLATWTTSLGARLRGALEVIEREAYMILWLNQLTMPRIDTNAIRLNDPRLDMHLERCERYALKVHAVRMPTDAPTHSIMVVLEDTSTHAPRFTVGLKAHRSLSVAIQKAILEALRSRSGYRTWADAGNTWDPNTPLGEIGHRERLYYWSHPHHAAGLEFLISGPVETPTTAAWERDTEEEHYERLLAWCREQHIPIVSVPLTKSHVNTTGLHVEMVVMPTLQNTYLKEPQQAFGGERWKSVPRKLGLPVLEAPYADKPHPFS